MEFILENETILDLQLINDYVIATTDNGRMIKLKKEGVLQEAA